MSEPKQTPKRQHIYPPFELVEPSFLKRVAAVLGRGLKKYGKYGDNSKMGDDIWRDFDQSQIDDIPRHIIMHAMAFARGEMNEDHLANIACNVMFAMYHQEKRTNGKQEEAQQVSTTAEQQRRPYSQG